MLNIFKKQSHNRLIDISSRRIRNFIVSAFISLILCIAGYFSNNWPLFSSEDLNLYTKIEFIKRLLTENEAEYPNAFFINTSFDKQLITVYEDYNDEEGHKNNTLGNTEITDRKKLLKFLKLLEQTDYGYIVLDIRFVEGLSVNGEEGERIDRELFDLIKSMPRCVVATHKGMRLLGGLESKAALADYKSTVTATNFVRYEYYDSIPSIPLYIYNDIKKNKGQDTICYHNGGLFSIYTEGKKLCQNSIFLEFSSEGLPNFKTQTTELGYSIYVQKYNYRNMGSDYVDFLEDTPEEQVLDFLRADMAECGKSPIVYIGNITEDIHDTYAGLQPGIIILYKALESLNNGIHHVSILHIIILLLFYFFITLATISNKTLTRTLYAKYKKKYPFLCFLVELLSITSVLFVVNLIDILCFHTTTNFFFTLIFFMIIKLYIKFKTFSQNETSL